jgi:hypothetical protein
MGAQEGAGNFRSPSTTVKLHRPLAGIAAVLAIALAALAGSAQAKPVNSLKAFKGNAFSAVAKSGSKIVTVGSAQTCRWAVGECQYPSAARAPLVARFTRSGKLDRRFNGTGIRLLDEETDWTRIIGVVARPDRSLLIGYSTVVGCCRLISLTRQGKLDRGFGEGGRAAIPGTLFNASGPHGMVAMGDSRVAIAGQEIGYPWPGEFAVLAIDASGEIDADFGDDGFATIGPPSGPLAGYTGDLAIQRGRGILALGSTDDSDSTHVLTAARLRFDGSLDPTFGTDGITRFTPLDNNIIGLAAGAIIPFGEEGIAAACDIDGIRSMGPNGEYPGSLFESGADERLLGCIDLADAAPVGGGIVAAGATYDDYGDGLPHPWMWQYERTESGKLGPAQSRRAVPRPFLGFNNGVAAYRGGFVVAGSLLSSRCRPPWRPGSRCEIATVARLTADGRNRSFGRNGIATLRKGPICPKPNRRQCR